MKIGSGGAFFGSDGAPQVPRFLRLVFCEKVT
ncbi:unknown [Roseburia sp. CAG:309]|nr:unknown [Roseburia sp. CAG:309]